MTDSSPDNTNKRVSSLRQLLDSGTMQQAGRMLNSLYPSEIADLLESLPMRERKFVWEMVDPDIEGDVLIELGEEVRDSVIQGMDAEEVIAAVEHLDADDMADLILSLPEAVIRETLASMDNQRRQQVEAVLSYPEDTAGGLMELNMVTIRPNVTVDVVLRYLRRLGEMPDHTDRLFVVDRFNRYLGTVPLDKVLTRPDDTLIIDLIDARIEPVPVTLPATEVARLFQDRDLISAPVVDEYSRLLGRITIDDVVDVIVETADKTLLGSAGLAEDEDIFAPIVRSARRRSIWLSANVFTAFLAASVIGLFEATIQQIVALAVLMPIVTGMGGNAGLQTLTLVIRAQALGQVGRSNVRSLFIKEASVGLLNGAVWALMVGAVATLWFRRIDIGIVIAMAMTINLLAAALAGVSLPILLRKINIDPALAGSVILTAVTDVIGFFAFLGIATVTLL